MKNISLVHRHANSMNMILIMLGVFSMIVAAYVRIPLPLSPVPFTLQTLIVYLSIRFIKARAGIAQIIYLCLGFSGLAVFSNAGSGIGYLLGPTGGYLFGFLAVTIFAPLFLARVHSFKGYFVLYSLAACIIYSLGIIGLMMYGRLSFAQALSAGLLPFIPGELIKLSIASLLSRK